MSWEWELDGWIVLAGILCSISCALLGNFLVLRKLSMLGDAISHAVLPGLAVAFFLSESRSSWPMFLGAVIAGVLTAALTEWIRGFGEVDEGASMGVVFTALFALGLVLIVQAADHVDLDPGCVLYGAIEKTPLDTVSVAGVEIPRVVMVLSCTTIINLLFVIAFYKELKITSFDPGLASALGINRTVMHYLLMTLVAVTAVASFESVGNILVVAMFVVPASTASLLTHRLPMMIVFSVVVAAVSATLGHVSAQEVPRWFGLGGTSTAGMMAVASGLLFVLAMLFAPEQGVITRATRHGLLALRILFDDVVALLYRLGEAGSSTDPVDARTLRRLLFARHRSLKLVLWLLRMRKEIDKVPGGFVLTVSGQRRGQELVRSHRLWEQYLLTTAGVAADRLHTKAEQLEHFTDMGLRQRLDHETENPVLDPHGAPIPPEYPDK